MNNMFKSAWTRHRPTSQTFTPVVEEVIPEVIVPKISVQSREESHQIMGKEVPQSVVEKFEHSIPAAPASQSILTPTVEPTPVVIETLDVSCIDAPKSGPVEVDMSTLTSENIDALVTFNEFVNEPVVIAETRHIDIHSGEVVAKSDIVALDDGIHSIPHEDVYDEVVDSVNVNLRDLGNATTESAYTYGIEKLRKLRKDKPDDWIVGHIFGGTYDLWIAEYNEAERTFFGFASFGGIDDMCAEWGYVSIDELLSIKVPPVGSKLERNFYFTPCTLDSIKNKEYEQKEQAIQLGADLGEDEEPTEYDIISAMFKDPNLIMMAGGYYYWWNDVDSWILDPRSASGNKLEMDDLPDIYFNTEKYRDLFITKQNEGLRSIMKPDVDKEYLDSLMWYPVTTQVVSKGDNQKDVPDTLPGARRYSSKWFRGLSRDSADEILRHQFRDRLGKTDEQLKEACGIGGGSVISTLNKPGIYLGISYDSKGITIDGPWATFDSEVSHFYTYAQATKILNTEIVQEVLPIAEEHPRVAELKQEVIDNDLPFKQEAELPPLKNYRKYELAPRPTDRRDRLIGNMVEEHKDNPLALYQNFSGKGGLHEVEFKNCENFHEYTALKQEFEMGQFFTPDAIAEKMVQLLQLPESVKVIDATMGMGRFFNFIPNESRIYGMDNSWENIDVCNRLYPDAAKTLNFRNHDLRDRVMAMHIGTVAYNIGNPPFNIAFKGMWYHPLATQANEEEGGEGILLSQNAYVFHTTQYLMPGGVSFFIVPQTWLTGLRHTKIREYINENYYTVAELSLDKKAFSEYEVEFPTKALLLVKKGGDSVFELETFIGSFDDVDGFRRSEQYKWFITSKKTIDQHFAAHKLKELRGTLKLDYEKRPYYDRLKKAIYETFRGLNMEDQKVLDKYKTEMDMMQLNYQSYQWEKLCRAQYTRLEKAIARKEKNALNVEVIISRYDIIFRRSNNKVTEYFNLEENKLEVNGKLIWLPNKYSKNDLCVHDDIYSEFKEVMARLTEWTFQVTFKGDTRFISLKAQPWLLKYIEKIRKQYALNTCDTALLKEKFPTEYEENYEMLSEMEFPSHQHGTIKLLPHQVEDLAGALLKHNSLITWDTGLGKTLGGITWSKVKGGKTLVIAPAVNTIDPWLQQIKEYRPEATVFLCKTKKDIFKYSWEDYLIVSLESFTVPGKVMVNGKKSRGPEPFFETQLMKNWFRNLIVDESDNTKNKSSKRFKSLRKIAKRFRNRLLMSGTPTRNNVNEIYNQLEILAQNSNAMMCWAEQQVEYDRSSREWIYARNPCFGSPFPAWGGYQAFERTFSPKKITCFGAEETNQDIFNKDIFDALVRSIRFTRIYDIEKPRINAVLNMEDVWEYKEYKQVSVPMSPTENKVYDYILTDLARQLEEMYSRQHDNQTASMLTIAQQIMKLLHGTSHPWTFQGFENDKWQWEQVYDLEYNTSSKLEKACEIIDEIFAKEWVHKIMIGSPWKPTEEQMRKTLEEKGYTVFNIRSEMSKHKRAELVAQFRTWPGNAIILGTMGVLKSGLNLPEVNTVIAESYPWNFAQLHQFAARAIRLNSTEKTTVYCLTSEGSFDVNVFSLILRKEVVNKFVRKSEETTVEELSKEFGVESEDIFAQALQMVREKTNGKTRGTIRWGEKPKHEESIS